MLPRREAVASVQSLLRQFPVVALLGARQVGKSTLARRIAKDAKAAVIFDLEDQADLARLDEPSLALGDLRGLVVLDEIQRRPDLFPVLRVLADRPRHPARFLVLGSASPALLRQSSETLAGRLATFQLDGFNLGEVTPKRAPQLWLRGGFPRSFLAASEALSLRWRQQFLDTFVERDVPALGLRLSPALLGRFWRMLAHLHGQIWNASEIGRSLGLSDVTMRHYLDVLASAFMVRVLAPFHENLAKRQVKAPKVYISDSGLLHALLGIPDRPALEIHPRLGASWEGFVIQEVIRHLRARREECYYWRTHDGAELDLLIMRGGRRFGFEIKRTDAPRITPSMRSALVDLRLDQLAVLHAGSTAYPLGNRIRAVPVTDLLKLSMPRK
jgi:predicted AAA+ superfamily ATPase